jgi:glycosyltransferase involved in cell wall biosynthesis
MLDPIGDAGIGVYTHELANAITALGHQVDVYTRRMPFTRQFARGYRLLPVLGRPLSTQTPQLRAAFRGTTPPPCGALSLPTAWHRATPQWRSHVLSIELATFLARRRYDMVWSQWPSLGLQEGVFREACRGLGVPIVHTVHNVIPHEASESGIAEAHRAYREADVLVTHSHAARDALEHFAPDCRERVVVAAHGLYTTYPRLPGARTAVRQRLGIPDTAPVALIFGGIRPYKNVDACLTAVAQLAHPALHLIVCGWEYGMGNGVGTDPLAHTRTIVAGLPSHARVHLIPGPVDADDASALFEAADIALLPYRESWGSGQLLMAMSFGLRVIVSTTGGMEEYVADYPHAVVTDRIDATSIASALQRGLDTLSVTPRRPARPAALEWAHIAPRLLDDVAHTLHVPTAPRTPAPSPRTLASRRSA